MLLPDSITLFQALKRWREKKGLSIKDIAKYSEILNPEKPITENVIRKWEKNLASPSYEKVVNEILPAYKVDDVFQFICAECYPNKIEENIIFIQRCEHSEINTLGMKFHFVVPEILNNHPIRIDQCVLSPTVTTKVEKNSGHEYILVIDGGLKIHFNFDEIEKSFVLQAGDAIAFQSCLPHWIENPTEKESKFVIARPAISPVRGFSNLLFV